MVYTPTTWVDGTTSANATRLNNIESGIVAAALAADAVPLSAATPAAPAYGGYAGSAATATRGDHQHPLEPARPTSVGYETGATVTMSTSGGGLPTSLNRGLFCPLYVMRPDRAPLVCSTVAVNVTTAASAGGTVRFGMWKATAAGFVDFTQQVFQSGELASTSTGLKSLAYTTAIPEGLYWCGVVMHTATCQYTGSSATGIKIFGGGAGITGADFMYQDGITGSFPTSGTLTIGGDGPPQLFFVVA